MGEADSTNAPQSMPRKRKQLLHNSTPAQPARTITVRTLPFTYLHLSLVTTAQDSPPIDALTARTHLTSALQQFLGVTGIAIPIDILKVEGRDVWIRVPREDRRAVLEAVSGWANETVTWRVKGKSEWLSGLVAGNGSDLFD